MICEMGINHLSCGPLGQQKRDSIIDLIFIPWITKKRTDIESCFCLARGKNKKHIELNLEVVISKIDDVIRKILFS